ncbi:MAG: hypothetical protein L3J06_09265 [Cyclobacteriaceae bacterium]|nr:hypothetical protein [Cyclobacteriaceae bacterium]
MKTLLKTIFVMLGMVFIGFSCQNSEKSTVTETETALEPATDMIPHNSPAPPSVANTDPRIPTELVCMVNDAFMGRKQYPVPVGDKIYYGCCEMCVDKLQNSDKFRIAIDPLTNEKVDKVEAYIVLASEETGAVYYFASEENYKKFKSKS